ncbi:hypothetical protein ACJW30_11G190900 [Castanea mollissima]
MVNPIPDHLKKIWDAWNVRGIILVSLSLQTILILFAPFRKCTPKKLMILLIWSSYLLADWAASFAIGHIANSQIPKSGTKDKIDCSFVENIVSHFSGKGDVSSSSDENADILAFWAPFLLVHLGGPDTITAFALEDNELWLRHLFSLLVQLLVTVYVFLLTLPKNKVWIPTILMFLAGTIKYCERTRALFLASLDKFRESMLKAPDPGPNYAKLMEEFTSKKDAGLPTWIEMTPEPEGKGSKPEDPHDSRENDLEELEVVKHAYKYFKTFKGLIVELIFSFRERNESQEFFQKRNPEDALKIIDLELNFIYEALFTKVVVVHSLMGYIFRFISIFSVVMASGFFFSMNKDGFKKFDVIVSYTLLAGAMCLDLIALFMLISSNWTIAATDFNKPWGTLFKWSAVKYLDLKKIRWSKSNSKSMDKVNDEVLATYKLFRRWSESVSCFKLISYCLRLQPYESKKGLRFKQKALHYLRSIFECFWPCIETIIDFLGAKEFVTQLMYVESDQFPKKLWNFIFRELLKKSRKANDAETTKMICSARGAYVFQESQFKGEVYQKIADNYIKNVTFDESLLLWHVATELCYNTKENDKEANESNDEEANESKADNPTQEECHDVSSEDCRHVSQILSDYMIYLLVMQPTVMSAVAGIGQIRFRDTCAEAENFFYRRDLKRKDVEPGCIDILAVDTTVKPVHVKGDRSKSVLFDACMLAKELKQLKEDKWIIMSKVWVEMLSYAATHCRPATHAQQVSKGGQLISFVWLLMAHFGLVDRFQINEGHARAKLIVDK